ncbi:MAG: DEAD/DEAH box helicase [Acidimicrobiales bacterium]
MGTERKYQFMDTTFADLGLPADLVDVLARQRIHHPFEIQAATIPDALAGRDVLGRAPTGSGKTLAFGLPLVARLEKARPRHPKALILSPTRELAEQIRAELEPLIRERGRTAAAIYGGVGFGEQQRALRAGVDLLVACPGRLIDLLNQGEVKLSEVNQVVIDEADRMADMGFLPPVRQLLDLTSTDRQTTLFSATLDRDVQVIIDAYQNDPVRHEFGPSEQTLDKRASHRFIKTQQNLKVALAADVITETGTTIVFCRTRHGVDRVARQLRNAGVKAGWIHGGRSQNQRDAALDAFTSGRVSALVATDVAARGIHVDDVAGVIHFDPPEDAKTYIHRSGRTARAGAGGVVVSFVNSDQYKSTKKMQKELGLPDHLEETPDITDPEDRPAPVRDETAAKPQSAKPAGQRRGGQGRRNGGGRNGGFGGGGRDGEGRGQRTEHARSSGDGNGNGRSNRTERTDDRPSRSGPRDARRAGTESGRPGRPNASGRPGTAKVNDGTKKKKGPKVSSRSGKPRPKNKRGGTGRRP